MLQDCHCSCVSECARILLYVTHLPQFFQQGGCISYFPMNVQKILNSRLVEVVHMCPPCPTDLTPPVSTKLDIIHMVRGTTARHTRHPTLHIGR